MLRYLVVFILSFLFFLPNAYAQDFESIDDYFQFFSINTGIEQFMGDNTYDIGISKLEFPVTITNHPYIKGQINISENLIFWAKGSAAPKKLQQEKFKDSDYNFIFNDNGFEKIKTIYSESDAVMESEFLDIGIKYLPYPESDWLFSLGLGFSYQHFNYEIFNVDQWYPNEPLRSHDTYEETALLYDITYTIPSLIMELSKNFGPLSSKVSLRYSGMVNVNAVDDHLLRKKIIELDANGSSIMLLAEIIYSFLDNLHLNLQYSYQSISTTGTIEQTRYEDTREGAAGFIAEGAQDTSSKQEIITAGLSYSF